jgi:hypothetical protein
MEFLRGGGLSGWPGFILLAALGAWVGYRREKRVFIPLLLLYAATTLVLVFFLNIPRNVLFLMGVYLVPTQALVALLGFGGCLDLDRWMALKGRTPPRLALILILIIPVAWGARVFRDQDKSRYLLAGDYGVNFLKELPRGSIAFSLGDQNFMPMYYSRIVEGLRPDLTMIPLFRISTPWGWAEAQKALGLWAPPSGSITCWATWCRTEGRSSSPNTPPGWRTHTWA